MNIIRVLDILSSVLILISLSLVTRSAKYWILYSIGSVFFTTVCIFSKLTGLTLMGITLTIVGIKNYIVLSKRGKS